MAYKLQLKRGLLASLPNGSVGEPLFTTDTFDLYVGKGDGTNVKFQKFIASGSSSQFLKGDGSLDSTTYQGVLSGSGIVKSTGGTISYLTDNTANWDAAYNDKINSASVSGTTTKTLTLTQQDGGTITASWSDYDTAPVTSVFGRTGAVVAASGDYTTSLVTEGTNLYFTDARARAAITLTTTGSSGSATYIGGTLNIPTYTLAGLGGVPTSRSLTINGTSYDLSADRSWSVGTVTSVDLSVPTGFTISGNPITSSGTLALAFATGYSLPTNASQTNWDAAYNDKINSASVTGTTTKTLTLNQQDGGTITASWTDINTDAVTSVFGRTGAVVAVSGDYTTTQVTEGTNLYYTEGRVSANTDVAANTAARHNAVTLGTANGLSLSTQQLSLALASGSTTGALSSTDWTTFNSKQAALNGTGFVKISGTTISYDNSTYYLASNPSNYITLTSLSGTSPISYNNTTGAISISQASGTTNGYLSSTDWNTFNNKQNALTNPVTGTGTSGQVAYFNGTTTITSESGLFWDATNDRLGIGTATPTQTLDVEGTIRTASTTNYALLGHNFLRAFTSGTFNFDNATVGQALQWRVSNASSLDTTAFFIESTGAARFFKNVKTNVFFGFSAYTTDSDEFGMWATTGSTGGTTLSTSGATNLRFRTNNAERMRIDSSGNVGINTTSPSSLLDVAGSSAELMRLSSTATNGSYIGFRNTGTLNAAIGTGANLIGTITNSDLGLWTTGSIVFQTNGSVRARIDSSGNLGLGVTPSAWNSVYKAINVGSRGFIYSRTDNDETAIGANWYRDAAGGFIYATNGTAQAFIQGGGTHGWYTAPSGTAGNAITFTQAMTLNASGRLLLGTTSDDGSSRLQVSGAATFSSSVTAGQLYTYSNAAASGFLQFLYASANSSSRSWRLLNDHVIYGDFGIQQSTTQTGSTYQTRLYIDNVGNVGIGTTSPTQKLDVSGIIRANNGTIFAQASGTEGSGYQLSAITMGYDSTNNIGWITAGGTSSRTNLSLQYGGGNVGIGTISPTAKLEVNGAVKTAAPTGYSAQPWKLGDATSGTITPNYYIKVEINGQIYSIPALQGTP